MPTQIIRSKPLHYLDQGAGFPVVLIHGFPLDHRIWEAQLADLSANYRVIAPDLPGFGQSAPSAEPFTMQSLADDLHALLHRIGALPCALAGLSMGGYVALPFWKKYAADLRALILIDTRAQSDTPDGRKSRDAMIELAKSKGSVAVADQMMPKMLAPTARAQIVRQLRAIIESCPSPTIQNALAAMRDRQDFISELPNIEIPTLIIVGDQDQLTPPASSELMNKSIPNSKLIILPGAAHITSMEQPHQISSAIQDFLKSRLTKSPAQ